MTGSLRCPDGTTVVLADGLSIGRAGTCDVHLDDPSVSREHAAISYRPVDRWYVEDRGSRNGTSVDDVRIAPGSTCRLHSGSRVQVAGLILVVTIAETTPTDDPTASLELHVGQDPPPLSPYQLRVVHLLAEPWLEAGSEPASNAQIAIALGTPDAADAVKAALRRAYAKAGIADVPAGVKRRQLCTTAKERGWI